MGLRCSNVTKEQVTKEINKKTFTDLGINVGTLTNAECSSVMDLLLNENQGMDVEAILKNKSMVAKAIAEARSKKIEEELLASEPIKIGNAEVVIGGTFKKSDARDKETLRVFTDNLQAYNALANEEDKVDTELIEPSGGVKVNVNYTSATIRTDSNGEKNPNAYGLVVKKNALMEDGHFTNTPEDYAKGNFQDTDEDFKIFVDINTKIIHNIKEALLSNDSPYKRFNIVKGIALNNAGLPKRFADKLAEMLETELGLISLVLPSSKGGYGLEIQEVNPKLSKKSAKNKKQAELQKELKKSLEAERPISAIDTVDTNPENRSILSKVFPEIENRKARVDFLNNKFSDRLSYWLQQAKDYYDSMSDEEMSEEDRANKEGLNYGNSAEQRIYALRHLTVEGMPLAQYIFKEMQDYMQSVISAVDNNDVDVFVKNVLLNENTQMGDDFAEEAYSRGWEGTELEEKAKMRTHHLANEFRKMLDRNVFDALLREMAFDLEFNENIRLDIDGMPVLTKLDIDDVGLEEGKEDANKEGYMVKYKLIDPATTLSVRMKTLLGGMYKIKYSDNGNTYAFDDLGQRIRMNPSVVYYILLDEFSKMNRPEDMDIILETVMQKYPWMYAIADKIRINPQNPDVYNPDLRHEFYTAFYKSLLHAAKMDKNGKLVRLNRDAKSETFLAEVLKAYEGHLVLGTNSIYTDTGECDEYNVANLRKLVKAGNNFNDNYYNHPLYWAKQILLTVNSSAYTIENLLKVLLLLRGKDTTHPNISLTALLNNLGVNTSNMNMETLLPDLDGITEEDINREAQEEDMSALDYFELNYFNRALMIKISNIIQAAMNITRETEGNEGGYHTGDHLINKFQSTYLMIGSALTLASDGYTQTSFRNGSDKVTRLSYVAPDKIAEMTGVISNIDDIQGGTEYIEEHFGRFPWFRTDDTWNNTLLELLYEPGESGDYIVRQNFEYLNVLDFDDGEGIKSFGKLDNKQLMKSMAYAFYAANDDARGNKYGYYRSPLFSDTEACVLLKLPRLSYDRIIEGLVKVMNQEIDRILSIKSKKPTDLKIDFFDKNGQKFQFFPELNTDEVLATLKKLESENNAIEYTRKKQEYLLGLATSILDKYTQKFLQSFSESEKIEMYNNIISSSKDKKDTTVNLDEKPSEKASQEKLAEADRLLTEFYQNDFFMQSQIILLYGTDIAYYKSFRDFIKRNKQVYACGERIYARDENGNPLKEKCLYLEDLNMVSNTWSSIKDLLNSAADKKYITQMEADILKGAVNSFKKINATDGLSFRTMKSFRTIFKAMGGKWTKSMEAAYKRITEEHIVKPEDFKALWHPIKPFMFSYEAKVINGRLEKIPVQHKNSEYLLSAMYSMLNTALNDSPELKALHKFMEDNDIDVVHFHSVVKEGGFNFIDINHNENRFRQLAESGYVELSDGTKIKAPDFNTYMKNLEEALSNEEITQEVFNKGVNMMRFHNAEAAYRELERQIASKDSEGNILKNTNGRVVLNEDMIHEFPLDDYMVVQPSGDHLTDEEAIFGSQLRNIIPADLPEDFSMEITVGDTKRTLNREEAVQYYNTLIVDNLLDAFHKVNKKFDNIEKLQEALLLAMKGNPKYGDDVKAALLLNESKTAFKIPFNSPNLTNKIEELILSTFKNSIQKQKIAGGNVVLVSNYGLTDKLSIKYRNNDPKQGIEYIPAYMPAFMRDMVEDYLEEVTDESGTYWTINFKELEKTNPDLLKVIGYRIPTEDKYSAMPIKIVGFLPEIAGTTIMLPSDIVNMSGTDFK